MGKKSKLGPDFWGPQWYRVDKLQHTEAKLKEEADSLGLQTRLERAMAQPSLSSSCATTPAADQGRSAAGQGGLGSAYTDGLKRVDL